MDSRTVYLSDGGPVLIGVDAIRRQVSAALSAAEREVLLCACGSGSCCVNASLVTSSQNLEHGTLVRVSAIFKEEEGALRILQIRISREYAWLHEDGSSEVLPRNLQTLRFLRQLLREHPVVNRIQSEGQTLFLNPCLIRYIQSRGKQCEIYYEDRVLVCQIPLHEIAGPCRPTSV